MGKKNVHKIGPLTEGKKNIIAALLEEYDIESAEGIQEALKDLLPKPSKRAYFIAKYGLFRYNPGLGSSLAALKNEYGSLGIT